MPYSSSYPFPHHLLPPTGVNPHPSKPVPPSCSPIFRRKNIKDKKRNMAFLQV
jgi:hypothetical protein